jgi:hypothetical protein
MRIFIYLLLVSSVLFISCSSTKVRKQRSDDAVRIKPEYRNLKEYKFVNKSGEQIRRNEAVLRGEVVKIIKKVSDDTLNKKVNVVSELLFIDSLLFDEENPKVQRIPLEHIDLVGNKPEVALGDNWFENFNDPLNSKAIRQVPLDSSYSIIRRDPTKPDNPIIEEKQNDCNCEPFSLDYDIGIECIKRKYDDYFAELRFAYGAFTNLASEFAAPKSQTGYLGEIATGFRFGEENKWGLGLAYGTGVALSNTIDETKVQRPWLLLHLRKNFDRWLCMSPFVYTQVGMTIDDLTFDAFKIATCQDCKTKVNDPNLSFSIPISYGFGFGLDIPIMESLDISFDLGYKRLNFGDYARASGFINVPISRNTNLFLLRVGVTY